MRSEFAAAILLALSLRALGQAASSGADNAPVTIRISADGNCYLFDTSIPCKDLGAFLLSQQIAPTSDIHVVVDKLAKYEVVTAALKSMQHKGIGKIGYVNTGGQ